MDGWVLAAHVRARWPRLRFVLASGSTGINPQEARARGVDAVIEKPYQPARLRHLLADVAANLDLGQAA